MHSRDCRRQIRPSNRTSLHVGGCTFPEDPTHSCALVTPLWSSAVDPCVLSARVLENASCNARRFDLASPSVRRLCGRSVDYLRVDYGNDPVRIDVLAGCGASRHIAFRFELDDDENLDAKFACLRALRAPSPGESRNTALVRKLPALIALDAWDAGLSLRDVADTLLGSGDWPGDGEHRKSRVRRLIAMGKQMLHAGPQGILATVSGLQAHPKQFRRKSHGDVGPTPR